MSQHLTVRELRRFLNTLPLDAEDWEVEIADPDGATVLSAVERSADNKVRFYQYGDEP